VTDLLLPQIFDAGHARSLRSVIEFWSLRCVGECFEDAKEPDVKKPRSKAGMTLSNETLKEDGIKCDAHMYLPEATFVPSGISVPLHIPNVPEA
jgi:hypothetical protein